MTKISKEETTRQKQLGITLIERSFVCITMLIVALILLFIYIGIVNIVVNKQRNNKNDDQEKITDENEEEFKNDDQEKITDENEEEFNEVI